MKKIFFCLALTCICLASQAQGLKRTFDDCITIKNYKVYKNDTVIINCDSLILMNVFTFNRYSIAYDRLRSNNSTTLKVFNDYDTLIADQQKRILEQNQEFGQLKFEYDSLRSNTDNIIASTQNELRIVTATLDSTSKNLNDTKVLLNTAEEKIRNEKYQRLKSKFSWGVGGLGIGLGVSALFFLLYQ